ncbi:MAG: bis(5'-nucleosyl)-tetraphosphatase (symmetrical) YqeK, partial [Spirochaetales bacterium]|nr:bis(5'-nucleosyl)-tetraphosphatase (symmetrical) YqeK [Spirochaetales bacterium]
IILQNMNYTEIEHFIADGMSQSRFSHTLGTAQAAVKLAVNFGISSDEAKTGALWHDAAREWSIYELLRTAEAIRSKILPLELRQPVLLHSIVSAELFLQHESTKLLQKDQVERIWKAVRWHTLGHPDMGSLGYVIFIADYCEPGRTHITEDQRMRLMQLSSLEGMMHYILEKQELYFQKKGITDISPSTRALSNHVAKDKNIRQGS